MPLIRKPRDIAKTPAAPTDPAGGLSAPSADDRWSAARQLGAMPGQSKGLAEALAREADPRVREALFSGLAKQADPDAIQALISFIHSEDAAMRTGALDVLATQPDTIAACVDKLLNDPDPDVRILSCDLVRRLPSNIATTKLSALLECEQVPNVCAAAVEVLSEVGQVHALAALRAAKTRFTDNEFLSYSIDAAIRSIGDDAKSGAGPRS